MLVSIFSKASKAAFIALLISTFFSTHTFAQSDPFGAATQLIDNKEYQKAIKLLNGMRVEGPDAVKQYLMLANALLQTGAGIASETALERARRYGASYASTVVPYAKALLIQGKYEDVLNALKGASIPENFQLDAIIISGDANFAVQNFDEAARAYQSALELENSDFPA